MENENNNMNMGGEVKPEGGAGSAIGIIIIILVLLAGAWYFLANRTSNVNEQVIDESELSTSTEIADIEADLGKINIDVLDQE